MLRINRSCSYMNRMWWRCTIEQQCFKVRWSKFGQFYIMNYTSNQYYFYWIANTYTISIGMARSVCLKLFFLSLWPSAKCLYTSTPNNSTLHFYTKVWYLIQNSSDGINYKSTETQNKSTVNLYSNLWYLMTEKIIPHYWLLYSLEAVI